MKLRDYAAILTGTLTFIASAAAQWIWTQRPVEDVIFVSLMIAFLGMAVFVAATEPKRKQSRRKHRAKRWEPSSFKIITLDRREWHGGAK